MCSLASFWIVSLIPFNNKRESIRDLTIFILSSISSFDIVSVVVIKPIAVVVLRPAVYAAAVNPNGIKTLLANGWTTIFY